MKIFRQHPFASATLAFVALVVAVGAVLHHHAYTLTGSYTLRLPPIDSFAASSSVQLQLRSDNTAQLLYREPNGTPHSVSAHWTLRGDDLLLAVEPNPNPGQSYLMRGCLLYTSPS